MASPNPQSPQFDMHKFFMPGPPQQQQQQQQQQPPSPTPSAAAATAAIQNTLATPPNLMSPPPPQQTTIPSSSYPPSTGTHLPHFPFPYTPLPHQPQQQQQQIHHVPSYPPLDNHGHNNPNNLQPLSNMHPQRSLSFPTPPLQPSQQPIPSPSPRYSNTNTNNNMDRSGAEIMALLRPSPSQDQQPPPPLLPPPQQLYHHHQHSIPLTPPVGPARMPSSKMPKGRRVSGESVVFDVDVRLQGEVQPQLEVTPITKYFSDPQLCLGRQIAVNKSYICYGLKQGNIRILNINTALRSLFRTQSQRVTDMAFFAEDVHFLASAGIDGRINVWKITEGPDEEDKAQISGKTVIAIQIVGEGEIRNPRVCWHCYKQEILVVGVGNRVLRIDSIKVGKHESSPEAPLLCPVDKLIDGVQLVGRHDGEVTDLSMCQWMTTRLVSASMDGTIKIWDDLKALPLAVLRPHDGQPVYSATFLTAPGRPDHIMLITAGPHNREVKIWSSASEEGWLLPGDADSLHCTQTLELKSSAEPQVEEAFFNQVVALSQVGLLLLANAKKNAIYAIHLDYGPYPAATRIDYISEFTVTMPILSLTGTSDVLHGQSVAQIYCVQTQAIQQYTLDLFRCLPPLLENVALEKADSSVSRNVADSEVVAGVDSRGSNIPDVPFSSASTDMSASQDIPVSAPSTSDPDIVSVPSPQLPLGHRGITENTVVAGLESGPSPSDQGVDYSVDQQIDTNCSNMADVPCLDTDSRNDEKKVGQDDSSSMINPPSTFKHPTHLITPSEILMGVSSSEIPHVNEGKNEVDANIQDVVVNNDMGNAEVEVKVVGETRSTLKDDEFGLEGEPKALVSESREKFFCSQASDLGIEMARECRAVSAEAYSTEDRWQADSADGELSHVGEEEVHESGKEISGTISESAMPVVVAQSATPSGKGKKPKGKNAHASGPSSPPQSAFNSTGSSNEQGGVEVSFPQISAVQEMLNQLVASQKEMQKQMSNMVAVPVSKECRRLEVSLGRSIEKAVKANTDALWARFQEENARNEKLSRDRTQQITSLISNYINKDLISMIEKAVKKELASVGPAVARTITPVIEKTISSSINESFQRGVGDKAVNQLEKSVNSKLEATVARQIQAQFQTTGRQALQDALKGGLEASLIPAFEKSCRTMFQQVDDTFKRGMAEHAAAAHQHLETTHSPLALTLREAITSASSLTKTLSDTQSNLVALAAAGANSTSAHALVTQPSNGPLVGLEKVEAHLDPTRELSRLISEQKYEEAFTIALQRSDVLIVSWLCSQVDLKGILSMNPLPLSQGVLLSLLQQLACDIKRNSAQKVTWMTDVAATINRADPMIAMHVRPIGEQVNNIMQHELSLTTISAADRTAIRILMHVLNSMMGK